MHGEGDPARDPRRRRPARTGVEPRPCPTRRHLVVTSPGWPPYAPLFGIAGRAWHPGLGRRRARLAAARPGARRAVAVPHRHQRQDDDGADARRDAAGRRAAVDRRRQRRRADVRGRDGPAAVRRGRGRALLAPAALVALAVRRGGRGAQRRARPSVVARRPRPLRRGEGAASTSTARSPASTTSRTRRPATMVEEAEVDRGLPGDRLHPGGAVGRHARGRRRRARRPGVRRGTRPQRRPAGQRRRRPDRRAAQRRQRAGRGGARPRARRLARRRPPGTAVLRARRAPDRDGRNHRRRHVRRRLQGHQSRMLRSRRCARSTMSSGSPAGWPRARRFDDLVAAASGPAARRRAAGCRPRPHRGGPFATRAGYPGHLGRRHRHWGDGACRGCGSVAGAGWGHGVAGAGVLVVRPVRGLRRARRRVRRGRHGRPDADATERRRRTGGTATASVRATDRRRQGRADSDDGERRALASRRHRRRARLVQADPRQAADVVLPGARRLRRCCSRSAC